jgi:hypothetical protein
MEDRLRPRPAARRADAPAPFWTRIRAIALYPFQGAALWSLIALSLCTLLGMLPGLVGLCLGLVTAVAIYKYAFEILRHTANGLPGAPEHGFEVETGTIVRLVGLMLVLGLVVGLTLVLTRSAALTLLVLAALVLLQPGALISLAMDGSLRRALNPAVPLGLATRIGWPYLAAFGLLFVIQASAASAGHWLHGVLPPVIGDLLVAAVSIWGLFATFHLMGYLVYQYHEVLGFEPAGLDRTGRHDPDQRLLDEAGAQVRAGRNDTALDMLRAEVRSRAVSLQVHELYHRLLRQGRHADALRDHARQYLARLLAERQERQALALLRAMLDTDADFVPAQETQALALVERARLGGQFQLATDLLLAMGRAWPRSPLLAQWRFEAAVLLAERFGRDEQARELLQQALLAAPSDDLQRRIAAALQALPPPRAPAPAA